MSSVAETLRQALADRYRVEEQIGSGGMATVFRAHDLRHDRLVAIKVLRPELASGLGPERFEQEIQIAARLVHPHILGLLDSGDAGGLLYYVMPFVDGESLRERLDRTGPLAAGEARRILRDIADALTYAHTSARPLFDLIGAPDSLKRHVVEDGGHSVPQDRLISETLGWYDRFLGSVER